MIERVLRDFAFAKWLEQLRRPESKKQMCMLFLNDVENVNHETACCLGHACKAIIPDDIKWRDAIGHGNEGWTADGIAGYLPRVMQELLDIGQDGEFLTGFNVPLGRVHKTLSSINDCTALTPQEIADIIEEKYRNNDFVPHQQGDVSVE